MIKSKNWVNNDQLINNFVKTLSIPRYDLSDVDVVTIRNAHDLSKIPKNIGGNYWIWTNEPVKHYMHKYEVPQSFDDGVVIYNGVAKDDIRGRIEKHLLADKEAKWSAISLDINMSSNLFAKKYATTGIGETIKRKVPFYRVCGAHLRYFDDCTLLDNMFLSKEEYDFVNKTPSNISFRNGINVEEDKHKSFEFRAYYLNIQSQTYMHHIETAWRYEHGIPQLCSYISGR